MWLITAVSCNWKQLLSANNTCLLIPFLAFLLFCRLTECLPTLKMALLMHNELSAACHAAAWRYRSSSSLAWTTENLRPKPRTAASPGKRKKKFRSLTVSALGFIYLNCTARQVHEVRSHADSSPIRLQLIFSVTSLLCTSLRLSGNETQWIQWSTAQTEKEDRDLFWCRRKKQEYGPWTNTGEKQCLMLFHTFFGGNSFASWFSGTGMQPPPCARELLTARSDSLHGANLKVSVHVSIFQPDIWAQQEIKGFSLPLVS